MMSKFASVEKVSLLLLCLALASGSVSAQTPVGPVKETPQPQAPPAKETQQPQEKDKELSQQADKQANARLRDRTRTLAQNLRQMSSRWRSASQSATSQLKGQELQSKLSEVNRTYQSNFVIEFKSEALTLESDLIKKLGSAGGRGQGASVLNSGTLADPESLNVVASYLEDLAGALN
jgi:hypothetical protein